MICLYNKTETDFSHNGVCVLDPSVCTVSEEAGGSYELYLEHPFDKHGKYTMLAEEMIIKAPVPHTVIPQVTLPERTTYTVNYVTDFWKKLPMPRKKDGKTNIIATIRANPGAYGWNSGAGYNAGTYVVYGGSIWISTTFSIGEAPANGSPYWSWVAFLETSGSGDPNYFPGESYSPGLALNERVTKLADYSDTIYQIRDQIGRVGYYQKRYLDEETTAPETIPEQTIDTQLFRIYSVESEEETNVLCVYARHISYDFAGNSLMDCKLVETPINNALAVMQGNLMFTDTRKIACQFEDTEASPCKVTKDWSFKNPVEALLNPDEGLVPLLNARLIRNNEDFFILKNDSPRTGPELVYGVNLKGVSWNRNVETVITHVMPRCKLTKDDHLYLDHGGTWSSATEMTSSTWVENDERYVVSPIFSEYAVAKVQVLDCNFTVGEKYTPAGSSNPIERTEASCKEEMLKEAQKRFTDDHCDGMEVTLSVDFTLMGDTEQYKQYRGLQRVNLYDRIPIKTRAYTVTAQVTAYEFDCLTKRYNSVDVGDVSNFNKRVPGFRVVNESITYSKLSPELISMIRTSGNVSGNTTGSGGSGGSTGPGEGIGIATTGHIINQTATTATVTDTAGSFTLSGTFSNVACIAPRDSNHLFVVQSDLATGKVFKVNGTSLVVPSSGAEIPVYVFEIR